jgi:hypothetical protein
MRRFLQRSILALVPAVLSALVLSMSAAASDLGLQSTAFSCNDGAQLDLALEPTSLTALSEAVAAINLYPAGDPALACSLSPMAPGSGSSQYDYAVGAGYRVVDPSINTPAHFALSAHEGPNGVFGTYNSMSDGPALNFDGDVTCLFVQGNQAIVGGVVRKGGAAGQQGTGFAVGFQDNGAPGNSLLPDETTLTDAFIPVPQNQADCIAQSFLLNPLLMRPVMPGNVTIRDAP